MKAHKAELALLGGPPAFRTMLHVGRPNLPDRARLLERFNDLLDRNWLTNNGPLVGELEQRVAELTGVKHCVAMCNGTVALEIAIRALGLTGEVIVPSFTFVATAHALQWQQITPVFCDINPETHTIDPAQVEALITPHTSGIIGVHLWGRGCDTEALQAIAHRRGLALLFDAAHAFACTRGGKPIGGAGRAEVFSFHATKFFNTFEGGAVTTNDDALAEKMRLIKNFGFAGYDNVVEIGTNGKMPEICAAMGLCGLDCLDEFIATNRRNYAAYARDLQGLRGLRLLPYDESEKNNYQYIVVEIDPGAAGLRRDELVKVLHAENVLARRYFWPGCHRMEPYRSLYQQAGRVLPATDRVADRVIVLPTGAAVGPEQIATLCSIIRRALDRAGEVREALAAT